MTNIQILEMIKAQAIKRQSLLSYSTEANFGYKLAMNYMESYIDGMIDTLGLNKEVSK